MMGARVLWVGGLAGLGLLLGAQVGLGQSITLDGTLGPAGTLTGPVYTIPQGFGTTVGTNLFHSFGRFDLATGERANFQSAAAIRNILARVTGGSASSIDGLIFTNSVAVNFFLINPAGIVFGPNASLDIGGTTRGDFTATTVDAIVWPDGSRFDAVNPGGTAPLLRIVGDPSGFLASQRQIPGITVNQSQLQVYNTQDLRLLGGDVALEGGRLDAWGGRVDLSAAAAPGRIEILSNGALGFGVGVSRGAVTLTDGAVVEVRWNEGGDIGITAGDIQLTESGLFAGINTARGTAASQAGDIRLDGTGTIRVEEFSRIYNLLNAGRTGNAGNVFIAGNVVQVAMSQLSASTFGTGNAGNVVVRAGDRVLFSNSAATFSIVASTGIGNGGNVEIVTGTLEMLDGAQLLAETRGTGDAGNVLIRADDRVLFQGTSANGRFSSAALSGVDSTGTGTGGNIEIVTGILEVRTGAGLIASTSGTGDAGNVRIRASDRVLFQGTSADGQSVSGVFSRVNPTGTGKGGDVAIDTRTIEVRDGAQLIAGTQGQGNAGNVLIRADDRVLFQGMSSDGEFVSAAFSSVDSGSTGTGGNIEIVSGTLEIRDGAQMVAASQGLGDAGNVLVRAGDRVLFDGTNSTDGRSSGIFTSNGTPTVNAGTGSGGDISISTPQLQVSNGAVLNRPLAKLVSWYDGGLVL